MANEFTTRIAELDNEILVACIVGEGELKEAFARPGVPAAKDDRVRALTFQTTLWVSIVQSSQDYMGKLKFVHLHMESVDGLCFPLGGGRTLVLLLKPQISHAKVIEKVQRHLESLASVSDKK